MTSAPDQDPIGTDDAEPLSFGRRTARVLALLATLLVIGLWGYALFWPHDTTPPGRLSDPSFAEQARDICAATVAELAALPPAYATPDPAGRADVVVRSDALLTSMLDRLQAIAPATDTTDGTWVTEWLGDWRTYVGDREAYAARLRTDPTARFYVTMKDKRQVSEPVDFFASANLMDDCATPDDIE